MSSTTNVRRIFQPNHARLRWRRGFWSKSFIRLETSLWPLMHTGGVMRKGGYSTELPVNFSKNLPMKVQKNKNRGPPTNFVQKALTTRDLSKNLSYPLPPLDFQPCASMTVTVIVEWNETQCRKQMSKHNATQRFSSIMVICVGIDVD
jgi:hypothetical protein